MDAWFIVIGTLLLVMALLDSVVDRLPLSSALVYLVIGVILGPAVSGWLVIDPKRHGSILELLFLITVLISLFTVGLKLRTPAESKARRLWTLPLLLAGPSMVVTIALVALLCVALGLPWGAGVLLAAMLAPTDPVLASDIQVRHEDDRDSARFGLSAEGGLNDATASPFVLLGLAMIGMPDFGTGLVRWVTVDLLWGTVAGFGIGWACGRAIGLLVLAMRRRLGQAYGLEEFLGLGLIALSYGLADAVHAIGFLAVLAAGLSMRRLESVHLQEQSIEPAEGPLDEDDARTSLPKHSPTHMVSNVLDFNQRFESIGEFASVLIVGALISAGYYSLEGLGVAVVLFFVIRPISVFVGTVRSRVSRRQKRLMAWFGIRGVGTLYYLMFVIARDLPQPLVERFVPLVMTVVASSIVLHGMSATPLMEYYERSKQRRGRAV